MTSYYVVVFAANKNLLVGGVNKHMSSRFETERQAKTWKNIIIDTNKASGRKIRLAEVRISSLAPEIMEHI